MKKTFFILILLLSLTHLIIAQSDADTVFLSVLDCRESAYAENYAIQTAKGQYKITEKLHSAAKTQYFGQLNLIGNYQLTNKPFQVLSDNLFMPVVPFWSVDQANMELNPNMLENPLLNGMVLNPLTNEVMTDPEGNPLFFFYSYLPADKMQIGTHHNFVFGPSFIQPIYLGGKIRSLNKIAQSGKEIASYNVEIENNKEIYKIEQAYWRIVDLQEKQKIIGKYLELLNQVLFDVENLYTEGVVTRAEVLQVNVKINEAELDQARVNNGLILSEMALCQLIGLPIETEIYLTDTPDDIQALPKFDGSAQLALDNRSEIKMLEEAQKMAIAQKDLMRSRFLPNAALTANYLFIKPNPYKGFNNSFGSDWTVGISMQIPLTFWGDSFYTMNASKELINIAELKKEEAKSLITLEVQQAWFKYSETVKTLSLMKKSVEFAEETLRISQDNFNEGMISIAKLLEAQTKWHKTNGDLIEAKTQVKMLEVEYKMKTGQF
ncbi:MAG: TolC family protein [Bacteroidales bacterium]|nr:TolC family protein [Bacteroidales bacterium]